MTTTENRWWLVVAAAAVLGGLALLGRRPGVPSRSHDIEEVAA